MTCVFVAGTDTDAGKTIAAAALLYRLAEGAVRTLAMKPVAAGAVATASGLRNSDALQLELAMNARNVSYAEVNPICLAAPIAPHIAAEQAGIKLSVAELLRHQQRLAQHPHDLLLIEGAGGWLVPLNEAETLADFAVAVGAKVVLVVGLKLGCLNHALLTAAAIQQSGAELVGWIGNQPQASVMSYQQENIEYLKAKLPAPCLGILPFEPSADSAKLAGYLLESQALMSLFAGN
ncbi:dethiobiotin synthase [Pseudidiomarina atlantica]|uniref:dethiobiotin synthase n=1 Tax=Pseudidiomarina atlantica TaxID=1517416 RepID=UPI000555A6AA|nr:dethiobiotin synthase [Pseudidiomarina atlantica]